jgi:hypothetical protein
MVAADAAPRAREVLADTMVETEQEERLEMSEQAELRRTGGDPMTPGRLAFWVSLAAVGAILLVFALYQLS